MPALSPTMEAGTIASWKLAEGESFSAGDSLAEIETDKATMDFEAQDDGIVAKILVDAGSTEIAVGVPVIVVVEEEEDVEAFRDFVAPVAEEEAKEVVAVVPEVAPVAPVAPVAAVVVEIPVPTPAAAAPVAPAVAPVVAAAATNGEPVSATGAPPISPSWGNLARVRSPLASSLSKNQKKYIELYGSTGQVPL